MIYHCCCTRWNFFEKCFMPAGGPAGRDPQPIATLYPTAPTTSLLSIPLTELEICHTTVLDDGSQERKDDNDTHAHRAQRERWNRRMNVGGGWNGGQQQPEWVDAGKRWMWIYTKFEETYKYIGSVV